MLCVLVLFREGNVGDKFYIIMNGSANVTKTVDGEEKYLDTRKVYYVID